MAPARLNMVNRAARTWVGTQRTPRKQVSLYYLLTKGLLTYLPLMGDNRPPREVCALSMASGVGGTTGENKKGEVNELKASLRNPAIDRDPEKKREVIKRVIAYMTLGIDVSKLFSEMIMVRLALPAVLVLVWWWPVPCPQRACAAHCPTLTDGER